ncbi:MAG TPA: hypothetical protein VEA92_00710 [Candidatus Paceibacterota bacterium]|nr:hypothetical protein [Candidatus Paceibacterota bacterium]
MKGVTLESVVTAMVAAGLLGWVASDIVGLTNIWHLLPDVWDNAFIASLLASVVALGGPRVFDKLLAWWAIIIVPPVTAAVAVINGIAVPSGVLITIVMTFAVCAGVLVANHWFGRKEAIAA